MLGDLCLVGFSDPWTSKYMSTFRGLDAFGLFGIRGEGFRVVGLGFGGPHMPSLGAGLSGEAWLGLMCG